MDAPTLPHKVKKTSIMEKVRTSIQKVPFANPIALAIGNVTKLKTSISNNLDLPLKKLRESILGTMKKIPSMHQVRASIVRSLKTMPKLQLAIKKAEKKQQVQKVKAWTLHVKLDINYKLVFQKDKQKADTDVGHEDRRTRGDKNLDLWTVGDIYPIDPRSGGKPQFGSIVDFMKFVGAGENGLLGYCKALASSETLSQHPKNGSEQKTTQPSPQTNSKSTLSPHKKIMKSRKDRIKKPSKPVELQKHQPRKSKINLVEKVPRVHVIKSGTPSTTPKMEESHDKSVQDKQGTKEEAKSNVKFNEKLDVKLIGKKTKQYPYPYLLTKKLNLMNQRIKLSADQRFDNLNKTRARMLTFKNLGVLYLKPHSIEDIKKLKALFHCGENPFTCSHVMLT